MGLNNESLVSTKRNFGFIEIQWQIKNYLAATFEENWIIESPVFIVRGNPCTKWKLYLQAIRISGKYYAAVYLERLECDSFSDPVWVSLKLFNFGDDDHMTFETNFEVKETLGLKVCDIDALYSRMQSSPDEMLVIVCSMFVHDRDSKIYERTKDLGIKGLSQDLGVLYKVFKEYDITLRVNGLAIFAHKAVLCSRNKVLKTLIEMGNPEINLPSMNLKAIKNVFSYLYTGNVDFVLRNPSFELLKCIKYLDIKELESYYKCDELVLCSEFEVHDCTFNWSLYDFKSTDVNLRLSPVFTDEDLKMSFRLHFYPKCFNNESECSLVYVEIVDGSMYETTYFEFAVMDFHGNCQFLQRMRWSLDKGKQFRFECILPRDILEKKDSTSDGNFEILCKIRTPTGSKNSTTVRSKIYSDMSVVIENHYELLSKEIGSLFDTGLYSDFVISCSGGSFKVHKYILTSRSYIFRKLFTQLNRLRFESFHLSNMKKNVLKAVLYYMYSGKAMIHEVDNILELYLAAESCGLLHLKYSCSSILQDNIEKTNISDVFVLAKRNKDYKLKASVKKCISNYNNAKLHRTEIKDINE